MRYVERDLGDGLKKHATYDMPLVSKDNYWASVTDVPCPVCSKGVIRWHEAGFVPGSRLCDSCGRFFQAHGSIKDGVMLVRDRRFDAEDRLLSGVEKAPRGYEIDIDDFGNAHALACPHCRATDGLKIAVTTWAELTTEGADCGGDIEWDGDSAISCTECGGFGTVKSFRLHQCRDCHSVWSESRLTGTLEVRADSPWGPQPATGFCPECHGLAYRLDCTEEIEGDDDDDAE